MLFHLTLSRVSHLNHIVTKTLNLNHIVTKTLNMTPPNALTGQPT